MKIILKVIEKNRFASCMPLISNNRKELFADVEAGAAIGYDFLEWRRDHFMPGEVLPPDEEKKLLQEMKSKMPNQGLIYTYRSHEEGGVFDTADKIRKTSICAALESRCVDYIDVELKSRPVFLDDIKAALKESSTRWIISHHNFSSSPSTMEISMIFAEMEKMGGDVLKLAVMPNSKEDIRHLIEATLNYERNSEKTIIAIAMGQLGGLTRIAPDIFGGSLTYVAGTGKTAPGQLTLEEIMDMRKRMSLI